ncbi:uncharacterized protein DUF3606 [Aminobacter sp. AP02]|nr:uncharacterized protein DUF3606 [Aminobacter sp. AP02]
MADDPKRTKQDGKLVSSTQQYEIDEFAHKYHLSRGEAAAMIQRYGPSRSKLDAIISQRLYG